MNSFDAVVYLGLVVAVITGFNTGLLRSAITILAYLFAMPLAVWLMSRISPGIDTRLAAPPTQNSLLFFGIFLTIGMALGKLARMMLDDTIGSEAGLGDRIGGAALGAVRVGLIATTVVLILDHVFPRDRQPVYLEGSQLRPLLSAVGSRGFGYLPPEAAATIDRLRSARQI
jgi:membrane protein required for colicin V production